MGDRCSSILEAFRAAESRLIYFYYENVDEVVLFHFSAHADYYFARALINSSFAEDRRRDESRSIARGTDKLLVPIVKYERGESKKKRRKSESRSVCACERKKPSQLGLVFPAPYENAFVTVFF